MYLDYVCFKNWYTNFERMILLKKTTLIVCVLVIVVIGGILIMTTSNKNQVLEPVPQLITSRNKNMIGKINTANYDTGYVITDAENNIVESKGQSSQSAAQSSYVNKFYNKDFMPTAITAFDTNEENGVYKIPEIMFFNSNVVIFTNDGKGWNLEKGNKINVIYEKYQSEIGDQVIEIGTIYNKVLNSGEQDNDLQGSYSFTADNSGEYYLYMIGGSTESITLKGGEITVDKH